MEGNTSYISDIVKKAPVSVVVVVIIFVCALYGVQYMNNSQRETYEATMKFSRDMYKEIYANQCRITEKIDKLIEAVERNKKCP